MEAVHVLGGTDAVERLFGIQSLGQGELYQNAVHIRVGIQLVDEGIQLAWGVPAPSRCSMEVMPTLAQAADLLRT